MPVNPNPVYDDLNDEEIDAESPLTESVMTRLRDNTRATFRADPTVPDAELCLIEGQRTGSNDTTKVFQPDGSGGINVQEISLGSNVVNQSQLDSSVQSITNIFASGNTNLSGGQYGFTLETREVGSGFGSVMYAFELGSSGYQSRVGVDETTAGMTIDVRQRSIDSSPPFDLGDGNIPLFIYAEIKNDGTIGRVSTSRIPPWAYNGPTRVRPDMWKMDKEGNLNDKKLIVSDLELIMERYNRHTIMKTAIPPEDDITKFTEDDFKRYSEHTITVPVSMSRKNKDIDIPGLNQPFSSHTDVKEVILLDPPDTGRLEEMFKQDVDIGRLIVDKHIEISNRKLSRSTPEGVNAHSFSWRNS